MILLCCSYAREWHEKLRELRESRAGLSLTVKTGPRSPERRNSERPEITIKPAFKLLREDQQIPLKVDPSGALNLSTGSPSPELSSPKSSTSPDTSQRISPSRSPQGYRPPSYTSVELCVVCGDRASGNSNPQPPHHHRLGLLYSRRLPLLIKANTTRSFVSSRYTDPHCLRCQSASLCEKLPRGGSSLSYPKLHGPHLDPGPPHQHLCQGQSWEKLRGSALRACSVSCDLPPWPTQGQQEPTTEPSTNPRKDPESVFQKSKVDGSSVDQL